VKRRRADRLANVLFAGSVQPKGSLARIGGIFLRAWVRIMRNCVRERSVRGVVLNCNCCTAAAKDDEFTARHGGKWFSRAPKA
jgi:hypothetical protein